MTPMTVCLLLVRWGSPPYLWLSVPGWSWSRDWWKRPGTHGTHGIHGIGTWIPTFGWEIYGKCGWIYQSHGILWVWNPLSIPPPEKYQLHPWKWTAGTTMKVLEDVFFPLQTRWFSGFPCGVAAGSWIWKFPSTKKESSLSGSHHFSGSILPATHRTVSKLYNHFPGS